MRLDKFLAHSGQRTRGEARRLLAAGRVQVDGSPARDPGLILDPERACVALDGQRLSYQPFLHLMLNKPIGVLTAARDPRHLTVLDLLPPYAAARGCMPVGRLDRDAEGLLLLTTDGQLAHRLLSPGRHVDKVYRVEVDGELTAEDAGAFASGLALSDFTALPAVLEILEDGRSARVTLREGKYHQIKRMFLARGRRVVALKRLSMAGVALDNGLAPGAWRELTATEAALLIAASGGQVHG